MIKNMADHTEEERNNLMNQIANNSNITTIDPNLISKHFISDTVKPYSPEGLENLNIVKTLLNANYQFKKEDINTIVSNYKNNPEVMQTVVEKAGGKLSPETVNSIVRHEGYIAEQAVDHDGPLPSYLIVNMPIVEAIAQKIPRLLDRRSLEIVKDFNISPKLTDRAQRLLKKHDTYSETMATDLTNALYEAAKSANKSEQYDKTFKAQFTTVLIKLGVDEQLAQQSLTYKSITEGIKQVFDKSQSLEGKIERKIINSKSNPIMKSIAKIAIKVINLCKGRIKDKGIKGKLSDLTNNLTKYSTKTISVDKMRETFQAKTVQNCGSIRGASLAKSQGAGRG